LASGRDIQICMGATSMICTVGEPSGARVVVLGQYHHPVIPTHIRLAIQPEA
jgi:hypothetical protein